MRAYVLNLRKFMIIMSAVTAMAVTLPLIFLSCRGMMWDKLCLGLMKKEVYISGFPVIRMAYPKEKKEGTNLFLEFLLEGNVGSPVKVMVSSYPFFEGIKEKLSEAYSEVYESNGLYIPKIIKKEPEKEEIKIAENTYYAPEITAGSVKKNGTELEKIGVSVKNQTGFEPDYESLFKEKASATYLGGKPQVLIIHTHGSESYNPDDRNRDIEKNIVRVGKEMARVFEENGIGVIHSGIMHDVPSYNSSYKKSMETVTATLKENPQINIVLDVHRDAMTTEDGKNYKTVVNLDGKKAAQVMFVVGSAGGGLSHPYWQENLKLAMKFQAAINERCENLARPINLRNERFNQQASKGSIIIEVGTNGNTLDEAVRAGIAAAEAMSEVIKGL